MLKPIKKLRKTKKVVIGKYYQRPLKNYVDKEGEFWQSVLLGTYFSEKRYAVQMGLYVAALILAAVAVYLIVG